MASGNRRDITPDLVVSLAHDKWSDESYMDGLWKQFQADTPVLARFITSRLATAYPESPEDQGRALTIYLEIASLADRAEFAAIMEGITGIGVEQVIAPEAQVQTVASSVPPQAA